MPTTPPDLRTPPPRPAPPARPSGRRRPLGAVTAAVAMALLGAGCSSGPAEPESGPSSPGSASPSGSGSPSAASDAPPDKGSVEVVRTLATGLKSPWGLAPLPDGNLLVASRDEGEIVQVDGDSGKTSEAGQVPGVDAEGEGGLLGLALSPDFATDQLVYAYFTTASDNRIASMRYDAKKPAGERLSAPSTIFKGIPKGFTHNGGRIAFGPDKMLYVGTGETGDKGLAQDKESLGGKILRMTPEGEPARGNPDQDSVVWSYGHRNVQGLAWDEDRRLWASEFGQDTWDELNHIEKDGNYGWPDVEGEGDGDGDFRNPVEQWRTADASPSGIAVAEGSVWMAGLRGERLWRIPLSGDKPSAKPQAFLEGEYGRLRTVVSAGGSKLWVVTNETDGRGSPEKDDDRILEVRVR